jgi:T-complex protein 1 subunit beta
LKHFVFSQEQLCKDLMKIAKTSLGSKILAQHSNHFAKLAVEAVLRLNDKVSLDSIQVIKKLGGSMEDSYLDEGFLLEKKAGMYQPQEISDAKILIANTPMDTDKVIYY